MKVFWPAIVLFTSTLGFSQSFEVGSLFSESNKNGKIAGVVLGNEVENEPLIFANVTVKNTTIFTTTEPDGSFSMSLKPGTYTLVFSFIGYKTIEVENVIVASNETIEYKQTLSALEVTYDTSSASLNF